MKRVLSALLLLLIVIVGNVSADNGEKTATTYISAEGFCRKYETATNTVYVNYTLQNNTSDYISLQLATTLDVQDQSKNSVVTYTNCVTSQGISCFYRIENDYLFKLDPWEKAVFSGEAKLENSPINNNFSVYSSLVYTYNAQTIALSLGKTSTRCVVNPSPTPVSKEISVLGLCRDFTKKSDPVNFTYSLRNETENQIALQLATTLEVEEQGLPLMVTYTKCQNGSGDCFSRIQGKYYYMLDPKETAVFTGTVGVLPKEARDDNFFVKTSMVYNTGSGWKPLLIGKSTSSCSSPFYPEQEGELVPISFCRTYNEKTNDVSIQYSLQNKTTGEITIEPATELKMGKWLEKLIDGKCEIKGKTCTFGKEIKLAAGDTIKISGVAKVIGAPDPDFSAETSLVYTAGGIKKALKVGKTTSACDSIPNDPTPPSDGSVIPSGFCRTYVAKDKKVYITYSLKNSTDKEIPLQLATTLDMQGQSSNLPITYSNCVTDVLEPGGGYSCYYRIKDDFDFSLRAKETAIFTGEVSPTTLPTAADFSVYTSLVYTVNGIDKAVSLGSTTSTCSTGKSIEKAADQGVVLIRDAAGDDFSGTVSAGNDLVTFIIQLKNTADTEALVRPDTIYFHNAGIDSYDGGIRLENDGENVVNKELTSFEKGETLAIPAHQNATIAVTLPVAFSNEMMEAETNSFAIGWLFNVDNREVIYNGTVDYVAGKTVTEPKSVTPEKEPVKRLTLHLLTQPELPKTLPATGFSTSAVSQPLSLQPADLAYRETDGLRILIPSIDAEADLVIVPLKENNEWAVEWLNDRAGILSAGELPGKGTSLIAAHNHLDADNAGPFALLNELLNNDRIFVEKDGKLLAYSVYANELIQPEDGEMIYQKAIPGSLVMMTCEEELPEGGYEYRRVVFAQPLQ